MNKNFIKGLTLSCLVIGSVGLMSCVDNDYDLDKDIDMTITIGGNLILPGSNTEEITLKKIFDLDDNSNVKADQTTGDYMLTQSGSQSTTTVSIDPVNISTTNINAGEPIELSFNPKASRTVKTDNQKFNTKATFNINQNITTDVVALNSAETNIPVQIQMNLDVNTGNLYINTGTKIVFPDYMTVTCTTDGIMVDAANPNVLTFTQDKQIEKNTVLANATITKIDFTKVDNQGLPKRGNLVIKGEVEVDGSAYMTDITRPVNAQLKAAGSINSGSILNATAKVDPKINITIAPIKITNLPDFLQDDDVTINLNNPKIFIKVTNPTPVDVNLTATMTPVGGSGKQVKIGNVNGGTEAVVIPANSTDYVICLNRLGAPTDEPLPANTKYIKVADINNLIEKIPDEIQMNDIKATATDEFKVVEMDKKYTVVTDYEFAAPLQFNAGTKIIYTDRFDGWKDDVEDFDFKEAEISITAVNRIPLNMVMNVDAIDADGNTINEVTATVEGTIAAGTMNENGAATSTLKVLLKSANTDALHKLDGLSYRVEAASPDEVEALKGTTLNEKQTIKLDNIRVRVKGGVTVDLN